MEALAQQLQDALGADIAVYLGSEWLDRQPQIPLVIVLPGSVSYGPPTGEQADVLASGTVDVTVICKALTFEQAAQLADVCYAAVATGQRAQTRLRTEVWGDYNVRVADMSITYPATLSRTDITRIRVDSFTQLAQFIAPPEVANDETYQPTGDTRFIE